MPVGGEPGRAPADKLAALQEHWAQLDPEQRYSLPSDATIARLAAESGLERGQVIRFFERRLVPRPEPSSDAESDSESELEPWDFGLSDAQNAAPEDAKSATRRGLATSGPSSSDSEVSSEDEEEEEEAEEEEAEEEEEEETDSDGETDSDAEGEGAEAPTKAEKPPKPQRVFRMPPEYKVPEYVDPEIARLDAMLAQDEARRRQAIESKRRALLYKELEAKLIMERKEKKQLEETQRKAEGEAAGDAPAAARSASLIDAIVQGQVGSAELTGLATAPASDVEASSAEVEQPRKKRREKAVRGPRKRRKRRYFWLVLKGVRTPGMRTKLFEGEWVEQLDRYDPEQAASPEERAFMEKANADFQKELKTPLPLQMRSFNDLPFLPIEHDIVYQHEDWEEDGRIAHRSLEVGDLLSGVVVDQYLHAGAFVDCCCEYNGIVWVSQRDWPGVEDTISLGRPVDVVVTAVRDPSLYRFPLELHCVDPDVTELLPNTRTPKEAPLIFPLDTTEADLERIAEITGREYLSPGRYASLKQEYRRHMQRGSQFLERRRRVPDDAETWAKRHGMRPPAFPYPPRPFRPARAPSAKRKTRKATDEDTFSDEPAGGDGEYGDEGRAARWDE